MKEKILLHTCCAPCLIYPQEKLATQFEINIFYFNPNIYPAAEYQLRAKTLIDYCHAQKLSVQELSYQPERYWLAVQGKEQDKVTRCPECYRLRLEETAKAAKVKNYNFFSTTLLVSPYQNLELLIKIGKELAQKHQLQFYSGENARGWQDGFRYGQQQARQLGLYRQKYCGCKYSLGTVK